MAVEMEEEEFRFNVLIVGKTGVGKSTFINYLYGDEVRETGTGAPITDGFEATQFNLNGFPVNVFDSKGLEAGEADEWFKDLERELKRRDISSEIEDWFHTAFYCFDAGGHRVEGFDIKIIRKLLKEDHEVNIILTKADQASKEEIEEMKEEINNKLTKDLPIIPVCSEEKELFSGAKVEPFGREKVEEYMVEGLWDSLANRLPQKCVVELNYIVEAWYKEQLTYIDENIGYFNGKEIVDNLNQRIENFVEDLNEEIVQEVVSTKLKKLSTIYSKYSSYLEYKKVNFPNYKEILESIEQLGDKIGAADKILKGVAIGVGGKALFGMLALKIPFIAIPALLIGMTVKKEKTKSVLEDKLAETKGKIKDGVYKLGPELKELFKELKNYYDGEDHFLEGEKN